MNQSLDDLIPRVVEGDAAAREQLIARLSADTPLDTKQRKAVTAGLEGIGDLLAADKTGALDDLVMALTGANFTPMSVRDALAAKARRDHSDYPDPAGLIRGLGILEDDVEGSEICSRYQAFSVLEEGSMVWHDSYGLGTIGEIDSFSDLIYVEFKSRQQFSLKQTLSTLSVVKTDSAITTLLALNTPQYTPDCTASEFDERISAALAPPPSNVSVVVEALMVPEKMSKRDYDAWRTSAPPAEAGAAPSVERSWHNSRSLDELKIHLADEKKIKPTEEQAVNLQKVFLFGATRANMQETFTEMLTELWIKSPEHGWLRAMIANMPDDTVVWASTDNFLTGSKALPAKVLDSWFSVTLAARGAEWLVQQIVGMPLRYWSPAETALAAGTEEGGVDLLFTHALETMRRGDAGADVVAWLWKRKDARTADAFANPQSLFRILSVDTKGEYIKARKDVTKLLMENEGFQRGLMDGGTQAGIATFVKTVKNMPLLNKGEQQSILVKICRIFPEAKAMVENRAVTRSHMPKITAFRSYKAHEAELHDIINRQIPENSAAIGTARDYGDLRENFEFKAAKEKQTVLNNRRTELERSLKEVVATDFSDISIEDVVVCGCAIELERPGKDNETHYLLGMWDSDPDLKILSYETPLGKLLIGKPVGTTIRMPVGGEATIVSIRELPASIKEWIHKSPGA